MCSLLYTQNTNFEFVQKKYYQCVVAIGSILSDNVESPSKAYNIIYTRLVNFCQ